jgi:hypothetical protein
MGLSSATGTIAEGTGDGKVCARLLALLEERDWNVRQVSHMIILAPILADVFQACSACLAKNQE